MKKRTKSNKATKRLFVHVKNERLNSILIRKVIMSKVLVPIANGNEDIEKPLRL